MNELPLSVLFSILGILLLLSAFFSSSETSMMTLNKYRLRHLANQGHKSARLATRLLETPEKLISAILIGNNLVNIAAASITTIIAIKMYPVNSDWAIAASTLILTLAILLFSEVTPKTLAQMYPERIAFPASYALSPIQFIFYPAIWLINQIVNLILWTLRIRKKSGSDDALTKDELKTLVNDSVHQLTVERQNMLLGILELENVRVNDIMVPRNEVSGINLDDDIETISDALKVVSYTRIPLYKGDLDKVVGMLHIRDAATFLLSNTPSKVMLTKNAADPYFVPENTSLYQQLYNFQQEKNNVGLVVDEYGDIQGLITLADILEEIVGEFTTDTIGNTKDVHPQLDGSFVIDGTANVREVNKMLDWNLPTDGPKTLNGLILEQLEDIPDANTSLKIGQYYVEILQIKDNQVTAAQVREINQTDSEARSRSN